MGRSVFKRVGAYFTVEAAMIMPVVLMLLAFIFHLTFYMYNRCVVSQDTYLLAFRGSLCCDSEKEEVQQYVVNMSNKQYGNKYIGVKNFHSQVTAKQKTVSVEVFSNMNLTNWSFEAKAEAERICPVACIRKWRLLKKVGNEFITE